MLEMTKKTLFLSSKYFKAVQFFRESDCSMIFTQ